MAAGQGKVMRVLASVVVRNGRYRQGSDMRWARSNRDGHLQTRQAGTWLITRSRRDLAVIVFLADGRQRSEHCRGVFQLASGS